MAPLQLAVKSRPVQGGHTHIAQDHLIRARLQGSQALLTVGRGGNVVATALGHNQQTRFVVRSAGQQELQHKGRFSGTSVSFDDIHTSAKQSTAQDPIKAGDTRRHAR